MNYESDSISGSTLPTDITSRTVTYRERGSILSLLAGLFAMGAPPRQRALRRKRRNAAPLSDHLRRDIGLPTESSRSPAWDEIR